MSTEITISIDKDRLRSYTDSFLAVAWHVAQANPAPIEDRDAGELAEFIGREIVSRWLSTVEPELWNRQGTHYWVARKLAAEEYFDCADADETGTRAGSRRPPTGAAHGNAIPELLSTQAD